MQTVLERFDSRRGIVGLLVVVSLLAAFIVVSDAILSGERDSIRYFVLFVVVLVVGYVGATLGWQRLQE